MFNPKVTIIIPVYNGSNYLGEAIESALAQTYSNIEILVINDGSNDNGATEKIALSFGDKINYIYKKNGGVATALNLGIEKATGEYISWLSHDDLYYSNKIEEQIKILEGLENKNTVITTDIEIINDKSVSVINKIDLYYKSEKILYTLIIKGIINGCTLLIPKICFLTQGNFDKKLKTTQDYDMWFRIIKKYNFYHLSQVLVKSRVHSNQDTIKLKETCIIEQKELRKHVHKYFDINEIKLSSGSRLPVFIFRVKLYILENKSNMINTLIKLTTKLGIYNYFSKIWRKYFLKIKY